MKKLIVTVVIVVVIGAGIAGWWYMFHRFDRLLEDEVQRAASEAFGTTVTVGDVDLDLIHGAVRIDDLAIGNPPGFERENAVVFGSIEAAMDYQTAEVTRVVLDGAKIYIEERGGETNIQRLKDALQSRISHEVRAEPDSQEQITIHNFLMRSTTATFESESLQRLTEVKIDQIELRDLEGTPDEVAEQIATVVIEEIAEEAGMAMLEASARKKLEDVGDQVGDKLKELLGDDDG